MRRLIPFIAFVFWILTPVAEASNWVDISASSYHGRHAYIDLDSVTRKPYASYWIRHAYPGERVTSSHFMIDCRNMLFRIDAVKLLNGAIVSRSEAYTTMPPKSEVYDIAQTLCK